MQKMNRHSHQGEAPSSSSRRLNRRRNSGSQQGNLSRSFNSSIQKGNLSRSFRNEIRDRDGGNSIQSICEDDDDDIAQAPQQQQNAIIDNLTQMVLDLQHMVRLQSTQIQSLQTTVNHQRNETQTLQEEVRNLERWTVLAAPIPGWGENEGFTHAMQDFIANFKKQIAQICNSSSNNGNINNHNGRSHSRGRTKSSRGTQICFNAPDGFGPYFDYSILMPYWKELGEAMLRPFLAADNPTSPSSFHLKDIKLSKNIIDLLAPGLMTTYFRTLSFDNNRFGRDGIMFVMDIVEHNPELETLILVRNPIEKSEDANRLSDLIRHHPSLKRVVIEECGSWTPSDLLYPIITASDSLRTISLEGNNISTMGRKDLLEFLATNSSLECLNLKGNQLNDDDAILIARALESNTTLTWLDLEMNNITRVGKKALFKTIFNPESLNSVADSNHMCGFNLNINGARELPSIINLKYGSPRLVREMRLLAPNTVRKLKLLALISAPYEKSINIHFANNVPMEMMPEVLNFVQQYPEVSYDFPDGLNTQMHWGFMSALRPDAPQSQRESDENDEGNGGDNSCPDDVSDCARNGRRRRSSKKNVDWSSRDYYASDPDDDSDDDAPDPKPAMIKRLNMVFEIMRGWKMETGEPLCSFATSDGMARNDNNLTMNSVMFKGIALHDPFQ